MAGNTSGSTGIGGGSTQVTDDGSGGTATGGTNASGTTPGGSLLGKCADGSALPVPASSLQTVTFTLRNDSGGTRYIVTAGNHCTPFGIDRLNGEQWESLMLAFGLPFSCNGTCGNCSCDWPSPTPSAVQVLEPGDTYSFDWNATSYSSCFTPIAACPEKMKWVAASQPVAAARYRLVVPTADAVPLDCNPTSDTGKYTCDAGALSLCLEAQQTCRLQSSASVEFTLPEAGSIQVELQLT